jgi:hypothetical protein
MVNDKEQQMTRKFNVGDVVINFESLALWDNTYHFEKTLHYFKKEVVVDADDYAFTTVPGIDVTKRLSMDWQQQNKLYSQRDGRQWGDNGAGTRAYVNWTTNENNIRAYLDNMFNEVFAKCDERDTDEIAKLVSVLSPTIKSSLSETSSTNASKHCWIFSTGNSNVISFKRATIVALLPMPGCCNW